MNTFHDFLVWFDGWSENIEKTPSEKQWVRLKSKIDEVRKAEPVPSAVPVVPVAAAPATPRVPSNEKEWRAEFLAALMEECGMDYESAQEVWSDYKRDRNAVDIARSARTEAVQASGTMN